MSWLKRTSPIDRRARTPDLARWSAAYALLLTFFTGCGDSTIVPEPATPLARRAPATIDTQLTEEDLRTFADVVRRLPGEKAPEFQPLARSTVDERLPAATLVSAYRDEYRRMFDPVEQGSRWRGNPQLMTVFESQGVQPEEFAALLTRMGLAVAAGTVSSRFNLTEASTKAQQQLAEIIARIDRWDSRAADGTMRPVRVTQHRRPLVDQLQDLVALTEFTRVLLAVPQESRTLIERHKQELAAHLPRNGELDLFERTLDAEAVIVPVSLERPE